MKNKLAKSMSMIIVIAMFISMVPAMVSAATNITEPLAVVNDDGSITVTATVAASTIEEYTLLAVRDDVAYVSDSTLDLSKLPTRNEDLEAQIEYIDQPALKDGAINATFELRERDGSSYGTWINILLGGEDTDAVGYSFKMKSIPPTLSIDDAEVWYGEPVVIRYAANANWEKTEVVKTVTVDGEEVNATIAGGFITIDAGELEVGTYNKVEITDAAADWETATLETTITVKSRVGAAKAEAYTYITATGYDVDTADAYKFDRYIVTVPKTKTALSGATITYTVTKDSEENANIALESNDENDIYTITRVADVESSITVKATITYTGEEPYTDTVGQVYTAKKLGEDGPNITATDVTILKDSGAYGDNDKALIKVVTSEVNAANETLKVGDAELYWSSQKNAFYGVIAAKINDAAITTETVAKALSDGVVKGASDEITFGLAWPGNSKMNSDDVFYAMRIFQKVNMSQKDKDNLSDKVYLAYDVYTTEPNGVLNSDDVFDMMRTFQTKQPALGVYTAKAQ